MAQSSRDPESVQPVRERRATCHHGRDDRHRVGPQSRSRVVEAQRTQTDTQGRQAVPPRQRQPRTVYAGPQTSTMMHTPNTHPNRKSQCGRVIQRHHCSELKRNTALTEATPSPRCSQSDHEYARRSQSRCHSQLPTWRGDVKRRSEPTHMIVRRMEANYSRIELHLCLPQLLRHLLAPRSVWLTPIRGRSTDAEPDVCFLGVQPGSVSVCDFYERCPPELCTTGQCYLEYQDVRSNRLSITLMWERDSLRHREFYQLGHAHSVALKPCLTVADSTIAMTKRWRAHLNAEVPSPEGQSLAAL